MKDIIFVSYEPEDAPRAATIIAALRGAGYEVHGDAPLAPGAGRREAVADPLERAWVVLVLWSNASTDRKEGRHVVEEARAAAQRGAYLGVLLDKVAPPFGFGGFQTVEMSRWGSGRDAKLAGLVEDVRRRMERLPAAAINEGGAKRRRRGSRGLTWGLLAAAIATLVAAAAVYLTIGRDPSRSRSAEIEQELAAIPCAWLQVDPVDNGSTGKLVLTGVSDDPERAGETIRGLLRDEAKPVTVTTDRVARIGSDGCPAIDTARRLRRDEGGRLRMTSDGVIVDPGMGLAEARVSLAFRGGDKHMALFGIEPSGAVTSLLPDFESLALLKNEDVGYIQPRARAHEFSLRSDHVGWTGLILLVGDKPFGAPLPQGVVRDAAEFARTVQDGTRDGDWQSEMVWYKIEPREEGGIPGFE